ncbi:septal ring lytic transglycosylase RlpA family protein [Azohydromonas australica]|uniref:septal ring lytic transglycosylase RlpA family protein n=1 Tax=Azohydromonas australica TaxID=364039 RepID=UPI0003F794C1|nr:septal ring lytic transglycosylase RlpA family protein [Azohydromonas australica]
MSSPLNLLCRCLALLPLAWSLGVGAAHAATRGKAPAAARVAAQAQQAPAAAPGHKSTAKSQAQAKSQAKAAKSTGRKAEAARAAGRGAASAKAEGTRSASRAGTPAKTATAGKTGKPKVAAAHAAPPSPKSRLDYSGRKRVGQASYYARHFGGRKMADGTPMRLNHHNAASKTLPLGTTAKVTNLKTGQSAVVKIQDRGPYVQGRIVDLSPATARAVGITSREGVAPVEVTPIEVPMPDGSVRQGEAAHDPLARQQIARAKD